MYVPFAGEATNDTGVVDAISVVDVAFHTLNVVADELATTTEPSTLGPVLSCRMPAAMLAVLVALYSFPKVTLADASSGRESEKYAEPVTTTAMRQSTSADRYLAKKCFMGELFLFF